MKELLRLNHTLAVALLCCVLLFVGALHSFAQLSPYDENAPVGWASIGQECTGSNNQNPVVVTSEEEIRAAMQACKGGKASKTIYISGQFEVKEKLRYDKMQNCTIYGLPGSALTMLVSSIARTGRIASSVT